MKYKGGKNETKNCKILSKMFWIFQNVPQHLLAVFAAILSYAVLLGHNFFILTIFR